MKKEPLRIAVTGGAGQIAYSLIFRLAKGELLGKEQPIVLQLLDLPGVVSALEGVKMELEDCAFPLLGGIEVGSDPDKIFEDISFAFLLGAKPREKGMERKDLLADNGKIFQTQAKALNRKARKEVKVLVVGNPCNTNCLIALHNAPDISKRQFFAMTRLDQNRARYQLAKKSNRKIEEVSNVAIWGNHSSTQVPDFVNALIDKKPALESLDRHWLEGEFFQSVQQRGAAIIEKRGKSSAASAASAAIDAMGSLCFDTAIGEWFSTGLFSGHNPYNISPDVVFSFPCRYSEKEGVEIVEGLPFDSFLQEKIALTQKELIEERDLVRNLL